MENRNLDQEDYLDTLDRKVNEIMNRIAVDAVVTMILGKGRTAGRERSPTSTPIPPPTLLAWALVPPQRAQSGLRRTEKQAVLRQSTQAAKTSAMLGQRMTVTTMSFVDGALPGDRSVPKTEHPSCPSGLQRP
jgi:hypothetical protein